MAWLVWDQPFLPKWDVSSDCPPAFLCPIALCRSSFPSFLLQETLALLLSHRDWAVLFSLSQHSLPSQCFHLHPQFSSCLANTATLSEMREQSDLFFLFSHFSLFCFSGCSISTSSFSNCSATLSKFFETDYRAKKEKTKQKTENPFWEQSRGYPSSSSHNKFFAGIGGWGGENGNPFLHSLQFPLWHLKSDFLFCLVPSWALLVTGLWLLCGFLSLPAFSIFFFHPFQPPNTR